MDCSTPSFPVLHCLRALLKVMSIESVMPSNHLILCHSLLLLPSILPSIKVFSNELTLHIRWLKYWSLCLSLSNEYLGLISFRIDWFDLLAVQGTLKSLLQHHSLKAYILQHSAFLVVQLAHPYMTTKWCLCFLICCLGLSQLFFQGECLLILWLQSPSSVILVYDLINLRLLPGLLYVHR